MAKKIKKFENDGEVILHLCDTLKYVINHIEENINGDYYNHPKTIKKCEKAMKDAYSYFDKKYKICEEDEEPIF